MDFYVFETETVNGKQAFATTLKKSLDDARMLFHQILASAYANKDLTYALVMILDKDGNTVSKEFIHKDLNE